MSLRSTSADNGVFFVRVLRISTRSEGVGNATNNGLSSLPGRIIAGSMISGLFVAATTYTPFRSLRPSNSVSRVFTTREEASDYLLDYMLKLMITIASSRLGTRASSSSKKMIHGADERARWNTCRTALSDSPTYYLSVSSKQTLPY